MIDDTDERKNDTACYPFLSVGAHDNSCSDFRRGPRQSIFYPTPQYQIGESLMNVLPEVDVKLRPLSFRPCLQHTYRKENLCRRGIRGKTRSGKCVRASADERAV
jgi:hypothetical protein